MSDLFQESDDATPLSPEEREGLIPTHIALRRELNELEQQNILDADIWAFQRRRDPTDQGFGQNLHRRMFGKVWRWAGTYRTTDKNIGVERSLILPELLSQAERAWLDAYHAEVLAVLSPELDADERAWLTEKCAPIA